jgi:acyl carrier protein
MTVEQTQEEILQTVAGIIEEVIGEQWVKDAGIDMDTTFSADLELESIEFVTLAEKLQERYGGAIDFPAWLSTMDLDDLINLTVGRLVQHIESRIAVGVPDTDPAPSEGGL